MRQYSRIFLAGSVSAVFLAAAGAVVHAGPGADRHGAALRAAAAEGVTGSGSAADASRDAVSPLASIRALDDRLARHAQAVTLEQGRLDERMARARERHGALETGLDASLAAFADTLQAAKSAHLAANLATLTAHHATDEGVAARLKESEAASIAIKGNARDLIAQFEATQEAIAAACRAHAETVAGRIARDRDDLHALEARIERGECDYAQARRVIEILDQKQSRLEEVDLEPFAEWGGRESAVEAAHTADLEVLGRSVDEVRRAVEALSADESAQLRLASAPALWEASETSLARLHAEIAQLRTAMAAAPVPAAPAGELTAQLEAVKAVQVDLGLAALSPVATLSGPLDLLVPGLLLGQLEAGASDGGVSGEAPGETAATPLPPDPPVQAEPLEAPAPEVPTEAAALPAPVEPRSVVVAAPLQGAEADSTVAFEEAVGNASALYEPVNLDLREMDLSNFVALLARKAGINVIAGTELSGTVTASIKGVPLRQALEMVLRMHDLGLVEEEGVFRIIPYERALATRRTTQMVTLANANVDEVKLTLDAILSSDMDRAVSVAGNVGTNVLIISGPPQRVDELVALAKALDVSEPVIPTVTEAIKLNYAEPDEVVAMVQGMMTPTTGKAAMDPRGRHLIVTDIPAVVEQVRELVTKIDIPVKQVAIESMIVDAVLADASETGTKWLLNVVRNRNTRGQVIGSLQDLDLGANLGNIGSTALDAGILSFSVLSSDIDLQATIAAEASSQNATILANPQIVIVENETGRISIVQDFPYQEITQTTQGPPVSTTEFKPIGVTLDVTPRVTHQNDIIAYVAAKQSSVSGLTETGVPIEDKREAETTLSVKNGQTIFIGGLRNHADRLEVSKIPVLGDVPVLNFLFRNTRSEKRNTELMIFLTCHVLGINLPELTPAEQAAYDQLGAVPDVPDAQRAMFRAMGRPGEMRDPAWKWRRSK